MKMLTLVPALLLVACGGADNANTASEEPGAALASDLKKPMDKAAAVEQQLMDQKDRVDAAIDEADSGEKPRLR